MVGVCWGLLSGLGDGRMVRVAVETERGTAMKLLRIACIGAGMVNGYIAGICIGTGQYVLSLHSFFAAIFCMSVGFTSIYFDHRAFKEKKTRVVIV